LHHHHLLQPQSQPPQVDCFPFFFYCTFSQVIASHRHHLLQPPSQPALVDCFPVFFVFFLVLSHRPLPRTANTSCGRHHSHLRLIVFLFLSLYFLKGRQLEPAPPPAAAIKPPPVDCFPFFYFYTFSQALWPPSRQLQLIVFLFSFLVLLTGSCLAPPPPPAAAITATYG